MEIETKVLHAGYEPKNGEPRVLPIVQSTTFKFDSSEHIGKLFDFEEGGHFYSRLSNPTVGAVEDKICALEGGVAAVCTSSGQAATMLSILNLASSGDHILCAAEVYGGTFNLLNVTMRKMGIDVDFINVDDSEEEIDKAFLPNTKLILGETIANPALSVLDIERFSKIAHKHGVPLVVDNTFATPFLCRPFEHGADIVIHSTTKYIDGHAMVVGGVVVDSGKFDWNQNDKFEGLTTPDESYHGLVYTQHFGKAAYAAKLRAQLIRDTGAYTSAMNAFLINIGLETLPLRMERHCSNAQTVAEFLVKSDKLENVSYPGLKSDKYNELAKKYLPKGCSGVITFSVKGGRAKAAQFIDSLKLASNEVHVADIRTCVLHPGSSTHRQLTDEQLNASGINPGTIRLSVGLENINDILEDIKQALEQI